jgi:hypothetical protein
VPMCTKSFFIFATLGGDDRNDSQRRTPAMATAGERERSGS